MPALVAPGPDSLGYPGQGRRLPSWWPSVVWAKAGLAVVVVDSGGRRPRVARLVAAHGPDVDELCRACVAHFPDLQGVGVAVMTGTAQQVRYASDAVSERVEQLQLLLGEGPCRDAFDMGSPVLADDLQAVAWRER
jgi:hypothetical protein